MRSVKMKETEMSNHNTKVSDSGYSNSCSNSQSQRSGSSKSRHSASSSGSSGYCGHPSTLSSSNDSFQRPSTMKRKEYKKKKLKSMSGGDHVVNESAVSNGNNGNGPGTSPAVVPSVSSCGSNGISLLEPVTATSSAIASAASSSLSILENAFPSSENQQCAEKENIQLNSMSHNLLSNKKHKGKDICSGDDMIEGAKRLATERSDNPDEVHTTVDNVNKTGSHKKEFSAVVSMEEGIVLYASNSLTHILGYPNDMWIGRSLIDFVHPKDVQAFNSHITSVISSPHFNRANQSSQNQSSLSKHPFYCCLRQYRGLKSSGFGVVDKKVSYLPCQLAFSFREISTKTALLNANDKNYKSTTLADSNVVRSVLLVITARPINSVYKVGDEMCAFSTCMVTRHSTSMEFTQADPQVVTYLGFLPQDIIGQSVFDYYHPDDLSYLKDVYKTVFKDKGQPFRSNPYRLRTQNGGYCLVETEWSSFINPWTKKIEFITGQHYVIKGPPNPDVITLVNKTESSTHPEESTKERDALQKEILNILNETSEPPDTSKRQLTKYCKDILTLMENFAHEEKVENESVYCESKPVSLSISDRDSVMLGEISPHHEYYGSKSSSETPPSYTQLNYDDNMQRFFESKPKTTLSDESGDSKTSSPGDKDASNRLVVKEECKRTTANSCSVNLQNRNNKSGGSSDLSFGCSSGGVNNNNNNNNNNSNNNTENTAILIANKTTKKPTTNCGTNINNNNNNNNNSNNRSMCQYRSPHLTEELLCRHNENMEKKMVQRHRERNKSDREHKLKDVRHKKNYDKINDEQNNYGVKRSGSHSWEGEPYKSIKQTHDQSETVNLNLNGNSNNNSNNNNNNDNNNSCVKMLSEDGTGNAFGCKQSTTTSNTIAAAAVQAQNTSSVSPNPKVNPSRAKHLMMPTATPNSINLWPPFSVNVTPLHTTQPCNAHINYPGTSLSASPMMPFYYVPEMQSTSGANACSAAKLSPSLSTAYVQPQTPYVTGQFQYLPSHPMMYHPVATAMPVFGMAPPTVPLPLPLPVPTVAPPRAPAPTGCPSAAVMYSPLLTNVGVASAQHRPQPLPTNSMLQLQLQTVSTPSINDSATEASCQLRNGGGGGAVCRNVPRDLGRGPSSEAGPTSLNAEPGSALCSVASNSMQQETSLISETSQREESLRNSLSQIFESNDSSGSIQQHVKPDDVSNDMLESSFHNDSSSFYSSFHSFLKTDEKSDESMKSLTENDSSVDTNTDPKQEQRLYSVWKRKANKPNNLLHPVQRQIRKVPPWLENVSLTPDFMYRYQVTEKELPDVLEADLKLLTAINQPLAVNDQLCQLYLDLEDYHLYDNSLETSVGITSSSGGSSGEADDYQIVKIKKKYRSMEQNDKLVMLYEENAPLPSPVLEPVP